MYSMRKEDYLSMAGYPNTPEGEAAFYREYDTPEKFQMKFGGTTAFPQARTEAEFYNFGAPMQFSTLTMKNGGSPYYAAPTAAQMFSYGVPAPSMMMFDKGGMVTYKLWEEATGTPWSEAKKQGLTDGSYEANMALRKKLLSGDFNKATASVAKPAAPKTTMSKAAPAKAVSTAKPAVTKASTTKTGNILPKTIINNIAQKLNLGANTLEDIINQSKTVSKSKEAKLPSAVKKDARYLESGMITDRNKNMMYVVKNGKVVKEFKVGTGQNRDINANANPYSVEQLETIKEGRITPTGTYLAKPYPNIYGQPGFQLAPIKAFGMPAPTAADLAIHVLYGIGPKGSYNYDPAEGKKRMKLMQGPGEERNMSYGCTNMYGKDIDCLTGQLFPKGDTSIVVDTRRAEDLAFLKNKYNIKKYGGGLPNSPNNMPCFECGGGYKKMQEGGSMDTAEQDQLMQIINLYANLVGSNPQDIIMQLQELSPEEQQQAVMQMAQEVESTMAAQSEESAEDQSMAPMDQGMMENEMMEQQMGEMEEEGMPMEQDGGMAGYSEGPESYLGKTTNFINHLRSTAAMANLKETYPFLMKNGGMKKMADGGNANELNFDPFSNWESFQEAYESADTQPGFREGLSSFFGGRFDDMRTQSFSPYDQFLISQEEEPLEQAQLGRNMPAAQLPDYLQQALGDKSKLAQTPISSGINFFPYRSPEAQAASQSQVAQIQAEIEAAKRKAATDKLGSKTNPKMSPSAVPTATTTTGTTATAGTTPSIGGTSSPTGSGLPAGVSVAGPSGSTGTTGTTTNTSGLEVGDVRIIDGKTKMWDGKSWVDQSTSTTSTTTTQRRPTGGLWDLLPINWQPYSNIKIKGNFPGGYEGFAGPISSIDIRDLKTRNPFFWGSGSPSLKRFKGRINFGPGSAGTTTTPGSTTPGKMGPESESDLFSRWEASGIPDKDLEGMTPDQVKAIKDKFETWKTKGQYEKIAGKFDRLFNNPQGQQILRNIYGTIPGGASSSPAQQTGSNTGAVTMQQAQPVNVPSRVNPNLRNVPMPSPRGGNQTQMSPMPFLPNTSPAAIPMSRPMIGTGFRNAQATVSPDDFYGLTPAEEAALEEGVDAFNKYRSRMPRKAYGGMPIYANGSGFNKTNIFNNPDENYIDYSIKQGLRPTNQSIADLSLMGVNMFTGIGKDIEASQRKQQFRKKMQDPTSLFMQNYDLNRGDYATNWNSFRPNQLQYAGPYAQQGGIFVNGMTQFLTSPVIKKINNIGGNTYE